MTIVDLEMLLRKEMLLLKRSIMTVSEILFYEQKILINGGLH